MVNKKQLQVLSTERFTSSLLYNGFSKRRTRLVLETNQIWVLSMAQ